MQRGRQLQGEGVVVEGEGVGEGPGAFLVLSNFQKKNQFKSYFWFIIVLQQVFEYRKTQHTFNYLAT